MKRIPHSVYATLFGVVHLALGVNLALAAVALPLIALLLTTDPSLSWPALALAAVLAGPGVAAAFGTFRAHADGETGVLRAFARSLRATWRRALALSALVGAVVTVALVDVFVLVPTGAGAVVAPLLIVVALLAIAMGMVGMVAVAEDPDARLRDVLRAGLVLAVRRWPLTVASFAVVAVQAAVVVAAPALGIGLTAAACLYVVWAGGRYTLQPVLAPAES
ncbi:ferredoxin-NADPH reductase [Microbacterium sp. JZ37]|uniref:ferredoxin-NADPH reductase n=1 Tax=Microbacterium sp. JZ37 TaxID=2654193 RepID=UPI002B482085|nr:ferredoxin-NADPH reductase [Microbacterium sp. JZ37]WRH16392.1 ferredoxin-NADPH reductase [Microbacterium sp. JZ37]